MMVICIDELDNVIIVDELEQLYDASCTVRDNISHK